MSLPSRPKGTSDNYLKIEPDQSVTGVFLGSPSFFYRAYEDGKYQYVTEYVAGYAFRFQMNFLVRGADGKLSTRIFENGGPFYDDLLEFSNTYDLNKTWIKISRKGTKKDTKYSFLPLPDHKVTDEQMVVVSKAPLLKLRGLKQSEFENATKEDRSFEDTEDDVSL